MTRHLVAVAVLAIDTSGGHLADAVRTFAGNGFLAVVAVLGVVTFVRRRLLQLVGLLAMAGIAAMFVYAPNTLHDLGNALAQVLEGG